MSIETKERPVTTVKKKTKTAIADCDIHPVPKSVKKDILPHMEKRWQKYWEEYGMTLRTGFQHGTAYPKGQPNAARRDAYPPDGGRPGSDLAFMREQHLDPHNVQLGILIPLRSGQGAVNADLSAAYCRAVNDWQIAEWTSREPRLKGSIVMPYEDPAAAVAEIQRRAGDRNFVQATMLTRMADPMGQRKYWPIYAAAQEADLPIGVHAFGYGGWPITGGGWPSYYIEDMNSHAQTCQALVTSMVFEGVFEQFPKLKLVVVEAGFAWMPALAWRLDKIWRTARDELSHLKRPPSEYIRDHIWMTTQPIEEPDNREHLRDVIDWIGWDKLLYASDYPHWDFDDPDQVLPLQIDAEQREKFFFNNALQVYGVSG